MESITINVYTADELQEQHPEAFERAHTKFARDYWDYERTESINDALGLVEMERRSPLQGRFIEWDVYRGWASYADGPLTSEEGSRLMSLFPDLYGVALTISGGDLVGDVEFAPDEAKAEAAVEDANELLRNLYSEFVIAMRAEEEWVESAEFFIDMAEANEWQFEADGRMR